MAIVTKNVDVAGRRLSIETGRVAEQANGAVILRQGDSVVLSTAVMSKEPRLGVDFFPLTCDYEGKLYAVGKIPGAFMRREGRPSETAIIASRLTDRPLRPLFPDGFRLDIQVVSTVLSSDQENDPPILSINGASTDLTPSNIHSAGPVGAGRVGLLHATGRGHPPPGVGGPGAAPGPPPATAGPPTCARPPTTAFGRSRWNRCCWSTRR